MAGKENGVQVRIRSDYPSAVLIIAQASSQSCGQRSESSCGRP